MSDIVDVEALGPAVDEAVDESAAGRAVVRRPDRVDEVDLQDGEVAARPDADDLGPDAEDDSFAFVSRPCAGTGPPADRVTDRYVGGIGVPVGAW
jgi:hypothetical protein